MEALSSTVSLMLDRLKSSKKSIFSQPFGMEKTFSIRTLDMDTDLPVLHGWVNSPHAIPFWQMEGPLELLEKTYREVMSNPHACSFIGCLEGIPVCQIDAYDPLFDLMANYFEANNGDLGMHLLLAPYKTDVQNLSTKIVSAFCEYVFSTGLVERVITEPDKDNRAANWLLYRLKFLFVGEIELPEKKANLFILSKHSFNPNIGIQ
jgi:acetyl CoA:N6-hydroxylysine acetyl transferase